MKYQQVKKPNKVKYTGLIARLIALGGCGGSGSGDSSQPEQSGGADVNEYLREVSNWSEYSPTVETINGPTANPSGNPDDYAEVDPDNSNCTITPYVTPLHAHFSAVPGRQSYRWHPFQQ